MSRRVRYFPRYTKGEPYVFRMVTEFDAKGRPKVARDRRAEVALERITARVNRPCDGVCIYSHGVIYAGTEYVKMTDYTDSRSVGRQTIYEVRNYHYDCVPERGMHLARFLTPMPWRSTMCLDAHQVISHRRFTTEEAWLAWCDRHYPSMRKTFAALDHPEAKQVGTDYRWCRIDYKP